MSITAPTTAPPDQLRAWILEQLGNMESIKPLSDSTLQLVEACRDPQFDAVSLVKIIESDPAVMARVLAVANSPLYGYSREIGSIQHALVILGKRTITRLALSFGTNQGFCESGPDQKFRRRLYDHSLACGLIARALTQIERQADPEMAFLGGVLHDIGKLVFCQLFSTTYTDTLNSKKVAGANVPEAEAARFGITHEELGKICATKWGFPLEISNVIGQHHGTLETPVESPLGVVVEAADYLEVNRAPGEEFGNPGAESPETANCLMRQRDPQILDPLLKIAWDDYLAIGKAI